jgi:hypothetical protein
MSKEASIEFKADDLYAVLKGISPAHLSLLKKVAESSTQEQFSEFLQSGELPAMKLSENEMKVLKAGKKRDRAVRLEKYKEEIFTGPYHGQGQGYRVMGLSVKIYF